jgi:hypothetical protein
MKHPPLAVIMIVALLTSDCVRNIPKDPQYNLVILLDKDFVKEKTQYKWLPWDLNKSSSSSGSMGGACLGGCPAAVVVAAVVVAALVVYATTAVTIHNAKGTNVKLTAVYYEDRTSETFELSWGINRFYLSEEKVASLENRTATLTLVATGTRNLEILVPYGILGKRDVHTIEFASDGKILADGIVVDSPDTQTEPQPASKEDLPERPQEPEGDDKDSQN